MEAMIYEKVADYLIEFVGERTAPGKPAFDATAHTWRVPVLCKTSKGIFPVGEFLLDAQGNFLSVPDRDQMAQIAEAQVERLPYLVFGDKEELERKGVQVVTI